MVPVYTVHSVLVIPFYTVHSVHPVLVVPIYAVHPVLVVPSCSKVSFKIADIFIVRLSVVYNIHKQGGQVWFCLLPSNHLITLTAVGYVI